MNHPKNHKKKFLIFLNVIPIKINLIKFILFRKNILLFFLSTKLNLSRYFNNQNVLLF